MLYEKKGSSLWDSKASDFADRSLPTSHDSLAVKLIYENKMIRQNDSALDIGCGAGRFSFALEKMGAIVTATDFSEKMIEKCNEFKDTYSSDVHFIVQNWSKADLKKLGWEKKFELVLANMTPAVDSANTFLKLSEASNNWCVMVKPTRRTNSVLDKINELLSLPAESESLDNSLIYAFELLWLKGFCPRIEYEKQTWKKDLSLDEAIREYTLRISSSYKLSKKQTELIRNYLTDESKQSTIHETTNTTIAALYWQV